VCPPTKISTDLDDEDVVFSGNIHLARTQKENERMLAEALEKAFNLLRIAFGATARFTRYWTYDCNKYSGYADFYWKKAKIAVVITGHRYYENGITSNYLNDGYRRETAFEVPVDVRVLTFPYYVVVREPKKFLATVAAQLIQSGAYPGLAAKILSQ
jgi:hypothetical protein